MFETKGNNAKFCSEKCRGSKIRRKSNSFPGRKNMIFIEYNGIKKSLPEWCEDFGILYQTAYMRYKRELPPEKIFEKKSRNKFDYTIKEEYDLTLISEEYRYILDQRNKGRSFVEIAKELGCTSVNVSAKAKIAISQLNGEKSEIALNHKLYHDKRKNDEKYMEHKRLKSKEWYRNHIEEERERTREKNRNGGRINNYQRKILKDLKLIEFYLESEDIESAEECLKTLIENVKNDIRK